ncbi:MAG: LapA family protein [Desulfovermiculus sp.]|nr:LapA family protein [Desulfovermiculus sp.]
MRYVKVLALVLFFFVAMVFFVQNTEILTKSISLKFSVFAFKWTSSPIPIYLYILIAFVLGAVLSTIYFALDKLRMGKEIKRNRQQIKSMQNELDSLRPKSLQEQTPGAEAGHPSPPDPLS